MDKNHKSKWEEGFITVHVALVLTGLMGLLAAVVIIGTGYMQSVHLQAVSDVAALSAVQTMPSALLSVNEQSEAHLCQWAQRIVEQNHKQLSQCWKDQEDLRIVVQSAFLGAGDGKAESGLKSISIPMPLLSAKTRAGY